MQDLRPAINSALKSVATERGVALKLGNGSYCDENGSFKLNVLPLSKSGEVITVEAADYKKYCGRFGLKPEYLGKTFSVGGVEYKITGLKYRARKYPVTVQRMDNGASCVISERQVISAMG